MEHPEWSFGFDMQPDKAAAARRRLLDRAASEHAKLLGFHWTYPGVGHIEKSGDTYRFHAATAAKAEIQS